MIYSSIGGKPCSIDERALVVESGSSLLSVIYGTNDRYSYDEHHDMYKPYVHMFQDMCDFLSTGHMSDAVRSLRVSCIAEFIEVFNLGFNMYTLDYLTSDFCNMLENQWYRSRRYHELYVDSWEQTFIYKLSESDMKDIHDRYINAVYDPYMRDTFSDVGFENNIYEAEKNYGDLSCNVLIKGYRTPPHIDSANVRNSTRITYTFTKCILENAYKRGCLHDGSLRIRGVSDKTNYSMYRIVKSMASTISNLIKELKHKLSHIPSSKTNDDFDDTLTYTTMLQEIYEIVSDWIFDGHIVIAGGSMCDLVSGLIRFNDIDMFFVGCTQKQAEAKLIKLFLLREYKDDINYIRTSNSITFDEMYYHDPDFRGPYRPVQFILRLYKDMEEVIMGFDIDASSICTDGKDIYATRECKSALLRRVCTVNFDRLSTSYESRLCKYAKLKGFGIYIPLLSQVNINTCYRGGITNGLDKIVKWYMHGVIDKAIPDYDLSVSTRGKNVQFYAYSTSLHDVMHLREPIEGLSKDVEWKTMRPGDQVTGSFHARVLKDISLWYESSHTPTFRGNAGRVLVSDDNYTGILVQKLSYLSHRFRTQDLD